MVVFCEYVIPGPHQEAFLQWVQSNTELWKGARLLENTGQPGVYVEIWPVGSDVEAAEVQKKRLEGRSWSEMGQWVKGDLEGLRIWTFRPVPLD
jgi:hypothetical protein